MGGGGRSSSIVPYTTPENPFAKTVSQYASSLWGQTEPIRQSFAEDYFTPFLKGNYKPETMPGFAPLYDIGRTGIEDQYNVAKQNIEASTPRGGAMTNALSNLEYNRAKSAGSLGSQISSNLISDLWNKAYNTGWVTAPSQAITGQSTAAQLYQDALKTNAAANMQAQQLMAQQEMSSNAGKSSGAGMLGTGLGSMLGLAMMPISGTSLLGSGLGALGGLSSGKGASTGGITSGLGGYPALMSQWGT
jgi:hypothetical protein